MVRFLIAGILIVLAGTTPGWAQSLAGTYVLSRPGTTLTLVIQHGPQGRLSGSLASTTGARYSLQGVVQGGVARGRFSSGQGGSFFEARLQGANLVLSLIEPGPTGQPDYSRVRRLSFIRQAGPATGRASGGLGTGQPAPPSPGPSPAPAQGPPGQPGPARGEIGHAQWGFAFRPPPGWRHRQTLQAVLLGHHAIAGLIAVFPHLAANWQELQASMLQGLSEQGVTLRLSGPLRRLGTNALVGEYQGVVQGAPARGRGIGTLSPYGGGAIIVAVTTPDKYGGQLAGAAQQIARSLRYFRVRAGHLVKHFSGYWWRYSGSAALSRSNIIHLAPDGTYRDKREGSASVHLKDQYGNPRSTYLGGSVRRGRGRWMVRGNKYQGVILVKRANGSAFTINYRVKRSRPQKFGSYYFNGSLYHWVTLKQLKSMGY